MPNPQSRATVRTVIANYFTNAGISFVGTVYSARNYINEQDYEQNNLGEAVSSENGSSAVLVVGIPSDERTRRADTGRGAVNDTCIHNAEIEIFFACTSGDPIAGQGDYDQIVDGIITALRADATLGDSTVIWSAGEYEPNNINHQQTEPFTDEDGMTFFIRGLVKFQAWEWIAGNV